MDLAELQKKMQALNKKKEDLFKDLRKDFSSIFAEFFNEHPEITSFGWTQYTPYWCDGEPCEFSAHYKWKIYFNGKESWNLYKQPVFSKIGNHDFSEDVRYHPKTGKALWEVKYVTDEKKEKEVRQISKYLFDVLKSVGEETLEHLFGEGLVTVHRDKVVVEDYEHE